MTVNEELRNRLRALVPTLSESTFDNADVPLRSALSHTEYQATVLAIQRLGPHVDRSAIEDGATWRDVAAWIANGQADPEVAPLPPRGSYRTRNATLRPVMPRDVEGLYLAALEPRLNHRWRFRGRTPSFGEFQAELLGEHVLAQYIVTGTTSDAAVGLVAAYAPDFVARHCHVAFQRTKGASQAHRGLMTEGTFTFIQYLFDHFDLRKFYLEVPDTT